MHIKSVILALMMKNTIYLKQSTHVCTLAYWNKKKKQNKGIEHKAWAWKVKDTKIGKMVGTNLREAFRWHIYFFPLLKGFQFFTNAQIKFSLKCMIFTKVSTEDWFESLLTAIKNVPT